MGSACHGVSLSWVAWPAAKLCEWQAIMLGGRRLMMFGGLRPTMFGGLRPYHVRQPVAKHACMYCLAGGRRSASNRVQWLAAGGRSCSAAGLGDFGYWG